MRFKVGDIVLVASPAGAAIPDIHVKLLKRVEIKPSKGNRMDWPGYSGWEATPIFQEEIDYLRKEWCIPFVDPEVHVTFVHDDLIVKKPRKPQPNPVVLKSRKKTKRKIKTSSSGVKVIRRKNRKNESRAKHSPRINSKSAKN